MTRSRSLLLALAVLAPLCALAFAPVVEVRWWKGNIHTHTLWSDGNGFPEMVVDWYRQRDYQFLALTDHNVLADHEKWLGADAVLKRSGETALEEYRDRFGEDQVETRAGAEGKLEVRLKTLEEFRGMFEEDRAFLLIEAEEITDSFKGKAVHLNATNLEVLVRPQGGTSVRDTIGRNLRAVSEQAERRGRPILAQVNHPNFGWAITAEDLAYVPEVKLFEIFNGHPSVRQLGDAKHAGLERMWDIANAIRIQELGLPPLFGVATDDSHSYHSASGATPGRGWVQVRAVSLAPKELIGAMEAGDFYASTGVSLVDVRFDGKVLEVVVDAVRGESYRIEFIGSRDGVDLAGEAVVDGAGEEIAATRRYPATVGKTLATVRGRRGRYRLRGRELYVRAVITSSAAPDNPVWAEQRKQAWLQPVGWRARLESR